MDQGTMVSRMLTSVADSSGCPHSVCYYLYSLFFFNNGSVLCAQLKTIFPSLSHRLNQQ